MSVTFLLSSLPTLEFGVAAPFSIADYRHRCETIDGVSLGDFDAVEAGTPGSHQFTISYANALTEIKNATASFRATKWEGENIRVSERSYSGCHVALRQKIADACNMKNPFEREMALGLALWQIVEELAGLSYFSEAKAYAYIVKLQINNRLASFNDKLGKQVIEEFIKANDREVAPN
ncbi:MAG: hypothetical protein LBC85_07175 [Fibromonadaceae bacterium]|jgi:hypothetical protein|nr:hypothetical protein [Fibromonadaceae bacterium]